LAQERIQRLQKAEGPTTATPVWRQPDLSHGEGSVISCGFATS